MRLSFPSREPVFFNVFNDKYFFSSFFSENRCLQPTPRRPPWGASVSLFPLLHGSLPFNDPSQIVAYTGASSQFSLICPYLKMISGHTPFLRFSQISEVSPFCPKGRFFFLFRDESNLLSPRLSYYLVFQGICVFEVRICFDGEAIFSAVPPFFLRISAFSFFNVVFRAKKIFDLQ